MYLLLSWSLFALPLHMLRNAVTTLYSFKLTHLASLGKHHVTVKSSLRIIATPIISSFVGKLLWSLHPTGLPHYDSG